MEFEVDCAHALQVASEFRLLNGYHDQLGVGEGEPVILRIGDASDPNESANVSTMHVVLKAKFSGGDTPLCRHINDVVESIKAMESTLRTSGHKVVVSIATDGMASDGDVTAALRPLKSLPCIVILRLCTNSNSTASYWDQIEKDLELNMDVLDDLASEANAVHEHNPWLTYGEPLHRLREFGVSFPEMDWLDERPLPKQSVKAVCKIL